MSIKIDREEKNPFVVSFRPEPDPDTEPKTWFFWLLKEFLLAIRPLIYTNEVKKPVRRYVIIDVETTGTNWINGRDRVIEIGAVAVENGTIVEEFHSLVNPGIPVPRKARSIHKISTVMLKKAPLPEDVMPYFGSFIKDSVLVAYNAELDIGFLQNEFKRLGLDRRNWWYLCTLEIFRKCRPKKRSHKLIKLAKSILGDPIGTLQPQRALEDARLLAHVWIQLEKNILTVPNASDLLKPMLAY